MIGSNNTPMSMFRGVGTGSGPSMYDIGYNGSPGGAVSNALRATIDKYHSNLAAQQEHQNKIGEIQAQSQASFGNETNLIDYKNKSEAARLATINANNAAQPNSGIRTVNVGGRKVYLQDYTDEHGLHVSKEVQPAPLLTIQNMVAQKMNDSGVSTLPDNSPNIIQQGANGSTTTPIQQIRVKQNATGQTGTINASEFDPSQYTRI